MLAGQDRWAQVGRVACEEMEISEATNVSLTLLAKLEPHLQRLAALKKPITSKDYHPQLVHSNLSGNILFPSAD